MIFSVIKNIIEKPRKLWREDILSIFNNLIIVTYSEKLPFQNYCETTLYPNLEEKNTC